MSDPPFPTAPVELPKLSPPVRFAGFVLDFEGCALLRTDGTQVSLTRGEFALLRELVRHHGRVLSREFLLDTVAGKRGDPFDRSIDISVSRLRRKIEHDPSRPTFVITVPGEGYKFGVPVVAEDGQSSGRISALAAPPKPATALRPAAGTESPREASRGRPRRAALAGAIAVVGVGAAGLWWRWAARPSSEGGAAPEPPRVAVLPFGVLGGGTAADYLGTGVAYELANMLATFPALRVVATTWLAGANVATLGELRRLTGARYVLTGDVGRTADHVRIIAQLYDTATGQAVWTHRHDETGSDFLALQADLADRLYQSVAGLLGGVQVAEQRVAWRKASPNLDEYRLLSAG